MRWQDAVAVEAYGPLLVEFGYDEGSGSESSASDSNDRVSDVQSVIDGLIVTKTFTTVSAALIWQDRVEADIRAGIYAARAAYATYPTVYPDRYRTV